MALLADILIRLGVNAGDLNSQLDQASKKVATFQKNASTLGTNLSKSLKTGAGEVQNSLNIMSGGMTGFLKAGLDTFKGLTTGIKGFSAAFISTGIGAIITAVAVAIGGLVAAFKRSGDAGDKMAEMLGYLKGILDFFLKQLIKVGEWLVKVFEDPKTAIKELWEVIKQNLINRFQGVVDLFVAGWEVIKNGAIGVGLAIAGIFSKDKREESKKYFDEMKKGLIDMGEAAVQIATGITPENLKKIGDEIAANAKQGQNIAKMEDALMDQKIKNTIELASMERQLGDDREKLAAIGTKNEAERVARAELINKILREQDAIAQRQVEYAQMELNLIKAKAAAEGDTSDETRLKIAEAQARIDEIRAQNAKERERFLKQEANLNAQIAEQVQKEELEKQKAAQQTADRIRKLNEETAILSIADAQAAEEKKLEFDRNDLLRAASNAEEQAAIWENYYAKLGVLSAEYQKMKEDESKSNAEKLISQAVEDEKKTYDEKLKILNDYKEQAKLSEAEFADYKKQLDDAELERKTQNVQQGLDFASMAIEALSGFQEAAMNRELAAAGDNEQKKEEIRKRYAKKQKTMAIVMSIINGAQAIIKAFADLGPIGGAISAVLIAATTAAQIATIKSQPLAKGGLAYGETLATVGEYAGARSNPEVIAPLDKLKAMISDVAGPREVRFIIEQNQLVGILDDYNRKNIYF